MTRQRISAMGSAAAIAAVLLLASGTPTQAEDTGISGGVESMLELSIEPTSSGRKLAATVTTTVSRTRLSLSGNGNPRLLDDFPGPVTGQRQAVRVAPAKADAEITFTLGPQGP